MPQPGLSAPAYNTDPYRQSLEVHFPAGSSSVPNVTKHRQLMIQLKEEYGYEDFQRNMKVVMKFSSKNQLDNLVQMFAEIDAEYSGAAGP